MNTIYDGTFTIGQTSATNFIAGNGIKIDEPSAGTVRIGNDETVLWSGTITATGQSVNLNESISNFSKLKFILSMDSTQYEYVDNNADRSLYTVSWQNMSNNDVYLHWMRISANNDKTKIAIDKSKALAWPVGTTAVNATAGYVNWEWSCRALTKIIGINRISGSNA